MSSAPDVPPAPATGPFGHLSGERFGAELRAVKRGMGAEAASC
jgi:hypothetical protein